MKFIDILKEDYLDPPEEDDERNGWGYSNSAFDDETLNFRCYTSGEQAIVLNKTTNEIFGVYTDDIDHDYWSGAYSWEKDTEWEPDEDGGSSSSYSYREFDDDMTLDADGIALYTQHEYESNNFTEDMSKYLNGDSTIVKLTPANKKEFYEQFHDEILDYVETSSENK